MLRLILTAASALMCIAAGALAADAAPAGAAGGVNVYTDNVLIVMDASGSMGELMTDARGRKVRKMDAAKAGLLEVLRQVPMTTHIGVVVFSASNVTDPWIYPLGPRNDEALVKAINLPQPSGSTPLGTFMTKAKDQLLARRAQQLGYGTYRLLVVTDGEANSEPPGLVDKSVTQLLTTGITVDVIGVGMNGQHTLARKVHSYRAANNPEALARAIREVFAEVGAAADTGDATKPVFDAISGIPAEVAASAIQALTGAAAAKSPVPAAGRAAEDASGSAAAAPTAAPAQPAAESPAAGAPVSPFMVVLVVILFVVFILAGRSVKNQRSAGRRGKHSR